MRAAAALAAVAAGLGLSEPAVAQDFADADDERLHRLAVDTFQFGCLDPLPDFLAGTAMFETAGLQSAAPGLFSSVDGRMVAFLTESPDGMTRTCSIGVAPGNGDFLERELARMLLAKWDASTLAAVPAGKIGPRQGFVHRHETGAGSTMANVRDLENGMAVIGIIVSEPEGFE